eukprot:CAMPEP_0170496720 /NCGR_PEP_ID=MMETSP0208-20121228/22516_1 /TAXON_ID=197538 /ORGANISM="Strombidium inclinatum, Strain S3" /LENGTH=99 /DNA_ID=CAMNT_0010773343 /DNA_START=313 /DNA_END=612 /DNA_ORIENTATION=+
MSTINTDLIKNLYDSELTRFMTYNFHLHHPAEYPVNGKHHDVGMHLIHLPFASDVKPGETIKGLVMAIQFSVDDYDRDISQEEIIKVQNFFDSLNFGAE